MRALRRMVSERALGWWLAALIALIAAFALGVSILIGQLATTTPPTGPTGPTVFQAPPVIAPPGTPLPTRIARKRTGAAHTQGPAPTPRDVFEGSGRRTRRPRRPGAPAKHRTPRPPARRKPSQRPPPAQPPSSPPPEQPKPPVCVTAPAPVTITTPVAGVNAC